MSQINVLVNSMNISLKNRVDAFRLEVNIVYAFHNDTHIVIYVKNTGDSPYSLLNDIDIFIKDYSGTVDYFNIRDPNVVHRELKNENDVLEPSETLEIVISANKAYIPPIEIRLILANGYSTQYIAS